MTYTLEQAKIDIARLQTQINAYQRVLKAHPGVLDVKSNIKLANDPTELQHAATKNYVDSNYVQNTGDETIAGIKTFTSIPVLPASDPTADNQAVRKAYVDAALRSFSPTDISNLIYWWDFSDVATMFTDAGTTPVSGDGDLIYQVNDKSGNAGHVLQATSANRPLYKMNIKNMQSASLYDGIYDYLIGPTNTNLSAGYSIFFIGKPNDVVLQQLVSIYNDDASGVENRMQFIAYADGSIHVRAHQNGTGAAVYIGRKTNTEQYVANTTYLFEGHYDGGTLASGIDIFINGVEQDAADDNYGTFTGVPSTTNVPFRIGCQFNGVTPALSVPWHGHIMEVIVYNAEISDANKQLVRKYLNGKWLIS